MAYALVAHTVQATTDLANVTTSAINTTGASLLILAVSDYAGSTARTISDSKSNTWTGLTSTDATNSGARLRIYYSKNPTVGSGHTFTASGSGSAYIAIAVSAFSGADTTSPFDVEATSATSSVTTIQAGSITPGSANELVIAALSSDVVSTYSIGSSYNISDQLIYNPGTSIGVGLAYLVQTSAAATNPTWSWSGASFPCAAIASFKAATGGGGDVTVSLSGVDTNAGAGTASGPITAITDSLISYWELEEVSGTRNDSHGTNHLTDENTVTQQIGKVGNAAEFTFANQERLSRTDNASLSFGTGVVGTFVAWVKPSAAGIGGGGILGKWDGTQTEFALLVGGGIQFQWSVRNTSNTTQTNLFGATASLGSWHFVVAQYDGSTLKLSVNNQSTPDSTSYSGDINNSNSNFVIGAYADAVGTGFNGLIDQVGFWKRVLTPTEITYLYNGGAGRSYAAILSGGVGDLTLALTGVRVYAKADDASPPWSLPNPPRVYYDTTYVAPTGATLLADTLGLQNAINIANPGDIIMLSPGTTYAPITLREKSGSSAYIHIQSTATLTPPGVRITTAQAASFPKIVTSSVGAAVLSDNRSSYYRLINVEFTSGSTPVNGATVFLGDENAAAADFPHHIILDRCYIHGHAANGGRRGVMLCGSYQAVIDSYVSDYKEVGSDTQAIACWTGYGPYKVNNNYLEGAGENLIFGGSDTAIIGLSPSDIEIRNNYFFKPLSWKLGHPSYAGTHWSVKNILELKHAKRVMVENNLFENCWWDSQTGTAILFTVRNQLGGNPWATVEDVTFRNNELRNSGNGINCMGQDFESGTPSDHCRRILISDNLITNIGQGVSGDGILFAVYNGYRDITIDHNTVLHDPGTPSPGVLISTDYEPSPRLRFTNNIVQHGVYGILGSGFSSGNATIGHYFPDSTITGNVIQSSTNYSSSYPSGNAWPVALEGTTGPTEVGFVNYPTDLSLSPTSSYHNAGTDGTDPGAILVSTAPAFKAAFAASSNQIIV